MTKLTLSNVTILEGEDLDPVRGYLVICGREISKIGEGSPPRRAKDLKRGFVIPPFVNAHTHLGDSILKEKYLGRSQREVVAPRGEKFSGLASAGEDEIAAGMKETLHDMLQTGTLAHCDFREGGLIGLRLLRRVACRAPLSIVLGRTSSVKEIDELLAEADGAGIPSLDSLRGAAMRELARRAVRNGRLLSLHVAETPDAQENSVRRTGKTEVERALELRPSFLVHGTWATRDDLVALRKSRVPLVFCPRANSLLGVGVPPIHLALEEGVEFWLGTDNAMVCQPDMFSEMAFAWACLRRLRTSAGSEEAKRILQAATVRPASKLSLPMGPIEEGSRATFLVLSRRSNLVNLSDVCAGLVNRARPANIRAIFLDGKQIGPK